MTHSSAPWHDHATATATMWWPTGGSTTATTRHVAVPRDITGGGMVTAVQRVAGRQRRSALWHDHATATATARRRHGWQRNCNDMTCSSAPRHNRWWRNEWQHGSDMTHSSVTATRQVSVQRKAVWQRCHDVWWCSG